MKIAPLVLATQVWSHEDDSALLSMKVKVHSMLESGVDQLLDVVGSRNVTLMADLLQNLVEETISEDSENPYDIFAKKDHDKSSIREALDMIKDVLLGEIRGAIKDAHCQDQKELHQQMLCFEECETKKTDGEPSCGESCDGSAHRTCRNDLLGKYVEHITACRALDQFVHEFSSEKCPKGKKAGCHLPHTTWNCKECSSKINTWSNGLATEFGTWIQGHVSLFEAAYDSWETLHNSCRASYHSYVEKDAECDCKQAECETLNCAWEKCHGSNCVAYDACWAKCEAEHEKTDKTKECLEKDRKIDWSATEKIECYINVLVEKPDNTTLLDTCGSTDCYNEYRKEMYKKCDDVCVEVDFDGVWGEHKRRKKLEGSTSGRLTTVVNQSTHRHEDIDVTEEGVDSVRTRHRHATDASLENRCTSHLDLDYQLPPCCQPCEARPAPPCVGQRDDGDYSGGLDLSSYMFRHYGQYGFLSTDTVDELDGNRLKELALARCSSVTSAVDLKSCGGSLEVKTCEPGEHTNEYAYNLCECIECHASTPPPQACTKDKKCEEKYDYSKHYPPYYCGAPPSNCKIPGYSETCHFWGDPHFTHLFSKKNSEKVQQGLHRSDSDKNVLPMYTFNPAGVFELAAGLDRPGGDRNFEAQAFFCPYVSSTTVGAGLAMKIGDDVIQVVRGAETAGSRKDDTTDFWADLKNGAEEEFTEFFVNGRKVSWNELGEQTWGTDLWGGLAKKWAKKGTAGSRGKQVNRAYLKAKKEDEGGVETSTGYLKQMKVTHDEDDTILPVCAGDNKHTLVEVGIPFLQGSPSWPMVYEQAVTIRTKGQNIDWNYGICTGQPDALMDDSGESYRVDPKKNLFSSKQMKSLCDMCGLAMHDNECGAPAHDSTPQAVCETAGRSFEDASKDCKGTFEDGSTWLNVCIMEVCASGDSAVTIARIEEHLQKQFGQDVITDDSMEECRDACRAEFGAPCTESQLDYFADYYC